MMEIELRDVVCGYGREKVLNGISLKIKEGEKIFIGGRNGSGKTTLLRVIAGLLPFEGEVLLDGKNIKSYKRRNLARLISVMPQASEMYFSYTVFQTVLLGRYSQTNNMFGGFDEADREAALAAMKVCGVDDMGNKLLNELSGGQLQRVLLARTFAQGTPFVLLDEPGSGLDIKYRAELCDYLNRWSEGSTSAAGKEVRNTVIAVFHDFEQARRVCDRTIFIKDGVIAADGQSATVNTPEILNNVFDFDVSGYIESTKML